MQLTPASLLTSWRSSSSAGAFGSRQGSGHNVGIAERWNGHHWILMATATISTGSSLNAVSCTGARACMAVGSSKGALAESWNGTRWAVQTLPKGSGAFLASVSCVSPAATFCTAVGESRGGSTRALTYSSHP